VVILDHVSPFADGQAMRAHLLASAGRDWLMLQEEAAYYGPLGSSMEEFISLVPQLRRRNRIRQGDRRLREVFTSVEHRTPANAEEVLAGVSELISMSMRRHRAKGSDSTLSGEQEGAFLREAFDKLHAAGMLRLIELVCDGQVCATTAALVYRGNCYSYQVCIEPRFADYHPGHHVMVELIRRSIDEGLETFNFLTGSGQYKAEYFPRRTPPFSLIGLPPKGRARSTELLKRLLQSLRGRRG